MKHLLLLTLLLSLSLSGICQKDSIDSEILTVVSKNRDTLIILDCPIGRLIYQTWINDPKYKYTDPIIILTTDLTPYFRRKED